MICERLKEKMPEYLSGTLDELSREKFLFHLESCVNCRREVEELGAIWRGLEFLPAQQPNPAMRT
ncbi:MAG: anti-ECFsigma factor, ChrR, partial [Bryobacterales bacterium]|nr:anti-ECFsigma factor, ChrR [Bryobacterales bacterium]